MLKVLLTTMTMSAFVFAGCDEKKESKKQEIGTPGSLQLQLANGSETNLLLDEDMAPTVFGQKVWSVTILGTFVDAIGETRDVEAVVWGNPACDYVKRQITQPHSSEPEDIEVLFEYNGLTDELCRNVGDYVDFARSSEAVNADFNAAEAPVPPGTYTAVKFNSITNDNDRVMWKIQAGNMTAAVEVTGTETQTGGSSTTNLATAIEIEEGDSVSLTLTYDYSKAIGFGPPGASNVSGGPNCTTHVASNVEYCSNFMDISASAQKK
jgi:hypothetical protein